MEGGVVFLVLIVVFCHDFSPLFTSSSVIRDTISRMAILMVFMILFNNVHPILSGNSLAFLVYSIFPMGICSSSAVPKIREK